MFVLLWSKVSAWEHSTVRVATLAGNGTQASVDGLGPRAALSEPLGLALASGTNESSLYFTEFGGSRYKNATRLV